MRGVSGACYQVMRKRWPLTARYIFFPGLFLIFAHLWWFGVWGIGVVIIKVKAEL